MSDVKPPLFVKNLVKWDLQKTSFSVSKNYEKNMEIILDSNEYDYKF